MKCLVTYLKRCLGVILFSLAHVLMTTYVFFVVAYDVLWTKLVVSSYSCFRKLLGGNIGKALLV